MMKMVTVALVSGALLVAQAQVDPLSGALFALLEYGVLGIALVVLLIAYIRKDRQVNTLYIRLIEKSERDAHKYHQLAEALNDTLQELTDAIQ